MYQIQAVKTVKESGNATSGDKSMLNNCVGWRLVIGTYSGSVGLYYRASVAGRV